MPHAVSRVHMAEEASLPDAPTEEASSDVSHDASPNNSSQSGPATSSPADKERVDLENMFDDDDENDSQLLSSNSINQEAEYVSTSHASHTPYLANPKLSKTAYQTASYH